MNIFKRSLYKRRLKAAIAAPHSRRCVINLIGPKYMEIMGRHFSGEYVEPTELDNLRVVAVTAERSVKSAIVAVLHMQGYASDKEVTAAECGLMQASKEMDRRGLELGPVQPLQPSDLADFLGHH